MFIGPVYASKRPQVAYSSFSMEVSDAAKKMEGSERNGETPIHAMELKKARLEFVATRPIRSGSKVCFSVSLFLE